MTSRPINPYDKAGEGSLIPWDGSLPNQFESDQVLQSILKRLLPLDSYNSIYNDLVDFGEKTVTTYLELAKECERYPPKLQKYDAFGHNINKIITCSAWKEMKRITAKEGIVSIGYIKNKYNKYLQNKYYRIYQYTKMLLFQPSTATFSCPIAMTDGAAKLFTNMIQNKHLFNVDNLNKNDQNLINNISTNLLSLDPTKFLISGQWMAERGGGSDIANNGTNTIAKLQVNTNGHYKLYGYKWFSSGIGDAMDFAITLARIEDNNGEIIKGYKGISMFLIPNLKDPAIDCIQLKEKLGTKGLPTAELQLNGVDAILLSKIGYGVQSIFIQANVTRIHNAIGGCAVIKRVLSYIRQYAKYRKSYNTTIENIPLHQKTLSNIDMIYRGCLNFAMDLVRLLGIAETTVNTSEKRETETLLRLLTAMAKLYCTRSAQFCVLEGVECMGGIGYLETVDVARMYRDIKINSIWEGTTNLLSIDIIKVLNNKKNGKKTWDLYCNRIESVFDSLDNSESPQEFINQFNLFKKIFNKLNGKQNENLLMLYGRDFGYSMCRIYIAALLYEHYLYTNNEIDKVVFNNFINGNLQPTFLGGNNLISQSLINLLSINDIKQYFNQQSKYCKIIGLGQKSKL